MLFISVLFIYYSTIKYLFCLFINRGSIYGRQTFHVRVCCSPKRDMTKDLKEMNETNSVNKGKKRKIEKSDKKVPISSEIDTKEYTLTVS